MLRWLSYLGKNREDQLRADIESLWESGKITSNGHVYFYIFPIIHVNTSTWWNSLNMHVP